LRLVRVAYIVQYDNRLGDLFVNESEVIGQNDGIGQACFVEIAIIPEVNDIGAPMLIRTEVDINASWSGVLRASICAGLLVEERW
jgi:hypothetical protein